MYTKKEELKFSSSLLIIKSLYVQTYCLTLHYHFLYGTFFS